MSLPALEEEEAADVPMEVEQVQEEELGEKGHGAARVSSAEEDGAEATPPVGLPTCCVCMEPWTCNGAHRIWHVHGRSCLERWLHRCGKSSAKCPRCGGLFALNNIINLYAPGNLWDGCCRIQELKALVHSELAKSRAQFDEQLKRSAKVDFELAKLRAGHDKLLAVRDEDAKRMAQLESRYVELLKEANYVTQNVAAVVKTEFLSMEQMERLVEKNATPIDLIGLAELY